MGDVAGMALGSAALDVVAVSPRSEMAETDLLLRAQQAAHCIAYLSLGRTLDGWLSGKGLLQEHAAKQEPGVYPHR